MTYPPVGPGEPGYPGYPGQPGGAQYPGQPQPYPDYTAYQGVPGQPGYSYPVAHPPYPPYPQARDTNIWAILALISAFSIPPLAIIAGHVALSQITRSGDQGRGLAIAGLVMGYVFTVVFILAVVAGAWIESTEDDPRDYDSGYTYSMSVTSGLTALQNNGPLKLSSV